MSDNGNTAARAVTDDAPRLMLERTTAEQRAVWDACPHGGAYIIAGIGDAGNEDNDARGIPWEPFDEPADELDGIKITGSIGVCGDCGAPVVTVRMADYKRWTPEHGPAWSTPWTRPIRDGEPRGERPANGTRAVGLYTRDGRPANDDLGAVREYGNHLRGHYEANPRRVERLARSRQAIAAKGLIATGAPAAPEWDELTDEEREDMRVTARNWLIAAHLAGLVTDE